MQTTAIKHIVAFTVICALAACTPPLQKNQARITISSFPEGAIISSGTVSGPSPQSMQWTLPGSVGYATATATWISGAKQVVRLQLTGGTNGTYVISRPNAPGVDIDVQYAVRSHQQDDAQNAALLKAFTDGLTGGAQKKEKVSCISNRLGSMVHTECE